MCSSGILKVGSANFIGNFLFRQFRFILTDITNLRNSPNTGCYIIDPVLIFHTTHMRSGKPPLIVGGTGQCRPTHHIARGINMRYRGLIVAIHFELTALIGLKANIFQAQISSIAGTSIAP